uniref:Uncharacterized protein n=1 Tax=Ditylenchus dipsaci TaxID=166011 RepID=A0A915DTA2_9BILA
MLASIWGNNPACGNQLGRKGCYASCSSLPRMQTYNGYGQFLHQQRIGTQPSDAEHVPAGDYAKRKKRNSTDFIDEKLEVRTWKSSIRLRQHETIVKFQAKKTKQVNLYSTTHHDEQMHRSGKTKDDHRLQSNKVRCGHLR